MSAEARTRVDPTLVEVTERTLAVWTCQAGAPHSATSPISDGCHRLDGAMESARSVTCDECARSLVTMGASNTRDRRASPRGAACLRTLAVSQRCMLTGSLKRVEHQRPSGSMQPKTSHKLSSVESGVYCLSVGSVHPGTANLQLPAT